MARYLCSVVSKKIAPNIMGMEKSVLIPVRNSGFSASRLVGDSSEYTSNYEVSTSPEEWKYVERVLPQKTIPKPIPKAEYPSGWQPQSEEALKLPYFIQRTKNHMLPVYLEIDHFDSRRLTNVRRIQGDIWLLESELKEHLQKLNKKKIMSHVNEVIGLIRFRGDFVNQVKDFLIAKKL